MSPKFDASFWVRMGLRDQDRDVCTRAIEDMYEGCRVGEFGDQGYCSFTLIVTPLRPTSRPSRIVQIRPQQHSLDLENAEQARQIYGRLAPSVKRLDVGLPGGLQAFEMELLDGVPISRAKGPDIRSDGCTWKRQVRLVESFASFIATAWPSAEAASGWHPYARADSPVLDGFGWLSPCTGIVGTNVIPKLRELAKELPDVAMRRRAGDILARLLATEEYPVVLNHGDLIPTNILVDEVSWEITGLVDWAEAEVLPFGTCLYGLEHLLGSIYHPYPSNMSFDQGPIFRYCEGAVELRRMFWAALVREKPGLKQRLDDVLAMRDLGVLLWSGYAWDEGKIDRVVNEVDDAEEVACLRAFLGVDCR